MVQVRTEQLQRAHSKITEDGKDVHISGQPGIGKTEFLKNLQTRLEDDYTIKKTAVRRHHEPATLQGNILNIARRAASIRDRLPNTFASFSAGVGFPGLGNVTAGAGTDNRQSDLHKLEELTSNWSGTPLILSVDNIHKVADDEKTVREIINELSVALGDKVHLITVGQVSIAETASVESIPLKHFTPEQTRTFLESDFQNLDYETVQSAHKASQGHPLILDLLRESSDAEDDLILPDEEVTDRIEERYLESLPEETEEFLRQVAVLPELDQKTVSGILTDYSQTEVDQTLRQLNRRAILSEVNQTDSGDKVYKIHEHFRTFLVRKHHNSDKAHREAFEYHLNQFLDLLLEDKEEARKRSLPHSFKIHFHLGEIHDSVDPETFLAEIDRLGIEYPKRGLLVVFSGIMLFPIDAIQLFRLEHETFRDWMLEEAANEPMAELVAQLTDWGISQFEDESLDLSEVTVDASLDDVPMEAEPFADIDLSEEHARRLENSLMDILAYFLEDEPYQSDTHGRKAKKRIEVYGISLEVLQEFRDRLLAVLLESELGEEFEEIVDGYFDSIGRVLEDSLFSSLDFHELGEQTVEFSQGMFDSLHEDLLLDEGVIEEIALEGGEVLEKAENPGFAMAWYSVFISYFRDHPVSREELETLVERFDRLREERRVYEKDIEQPMLSTDAMEEKAKVDSQGTD